MSDGSGLDDTRRAGAIGVSITRSIAIVGTTFTPYWDGASMLIDVLFEHADFDLMRVIISFSRPYHHCPRTTRTSLDTECIGSLRKSEHPTLGSLIIVSTLGCLDRTMVTDLYLTGDLGGRWYLTHIDGEDGLEMS